MRKITVSLSKGGVGKTTTAVNLAAGLSRSGFTVLLVDTDTQGQTAGALGLQPTAGLAELITGELGPDETIIQARDNLYLLAGGRNLAGIKRMIDRKDFGGENTLSEGLQQIEGEYDFIVLDTAPGWDSLSVNVLFYSDEILAPVSMEILTLTGLLDFQQSIKAIQKYRKNLQVKYILPTFYDMRVKKSGEILEQITEFYGPAVCGPVRYSVRLSEAPGFGQNIFEYAPRSTGAIDYTRLVERIAQDGR